MKRILASSTLALSAWCLLPSASASAQEFFASAYARPVEMVDGIHVGTRVERTDVFAPAKVVTAQVVTQEPRLGGGWSSTRN